MTWEDEKGPDAKLAELVGEKQINEKAGYGDALIWNEHEHVGFPVSRFPGLLEGSTVAALLLDGQSVVEGDHLLMPR
jgi:hypothetical protein